MDKIQKNLSQSKIRARPTPLCFQRARVRTYRRLNALPAESGRRGRSSPSRPRRSIGSTSALLGRTRTTVGLLLSRPRPPDRGRIATRGSSWPRGSVRCWAAWVPPTTLPATEPAAASRSTRPVTSLPCHPDDRTVRRIGERGVEQPQETANSKLQTANSKQQTACAYRVVWR